MPSHQPPPHLSLNSFSDLSKLTILVVDDVRLNREFAVEMLAELGVAADVAENGQQAVDKVQQKPFDVVLMDLEMPVMNGLEACKAIRDLGGHFTSLPIIAMTAHSVDKVKTRCLETGMNYFLTKPFDANQVVQTLFKMAS